MVSYLEQRELDGLKIGYDDFWNKTLRDLWLYEKAYEHRRKEELQLQVQMDYNNCLLLGDVIGKLLSGKGSISPIEKLYPRLFADRAEMEKQITAEEDLEFQRQMASFKAFTQVYNIQHNGGST